MNTSYYLLSISTDATAFDQSVPSLDFVIGSSDTQCYNISIDFDMDDYCEQFISCNTTLQSQLTKVNENDHVIITKETVEVIINEWAGKCCKIRFIILIFMSYF